MKSAHVFFSVIFSLNLFNIFNLSTCTWIHLCFGGISNVNLSNFTNRLSVIVNLYARSSSFAALIQSINKLLNNQQTIHDHYALKRSSQLI